MKRHSFAALKALIFTVAILLVSTETFAQGQVSVKFSVDMNLLMSENKFTPGTDRLLIRGSFNNWGDQTSLNREGTTTIFSTYVSLNSNSYFTYKFFINTPGAANNGWESLPGFFSNGNRTLHTGIIQLVLPAVAFNNADMVLNKTTDHFNFYSTSQDISALTSFSNKLESEYDRIGTFLEVTIPQKIEVYVFKSLALYHNAMGYPEFPDWAVGSALGKTTILTVSPNHAGSTSYAAMMNVIIHEFVHINEAWKTTVSLPTWLNEGVASYLPNQVSPVISVIRSRISSYGSLPTLSLFENTNTFAENGGYEVCMTIPEFIVKTQGMSKLAQFVETVSYNVLGYSSKTAFQTAWQGFLNNYYVNTPPPAVSIGIIRRFGDSWFINYSPHAEKDVDNNILTYSITVTAEGFSKSYTDNTHSGTFIIPKADFPANTTFTVSARTYDGIVYTNTATTKTFSSANLLPTPFSFTAPSNGQVVTYNTDHQVRISWSPAQGVDTDGDPVTDRIKIEGNGLDKAGSRFGRIHSGRFR